MGSFSLLSGLSANCNQYYSSYKRNSRLKKKVSDNSMVVSGIFRGISIRSLSLQSTTLLKHVHGYGHTGTLHV